MSRAITLLLSGILAMPLPALAAVCEARSGNVTVALLELYTSEGCNSCPPADRWLAELPQRGFGPERVVPLAFHVDYWNHLGWEDRFSQAAFTQRQRDFARRANARTIYTPELLLNGREYRRGLFDRFGSDLARINGAPPQADIALRLEHGTPALRVDARAKLKQPARDAGLYLAVYENNLHTEVRAGENRGHALTHAFVVHHLVGPIRFDAGGRAHADHTVKLDPEWKTADVGVAAFVQELEGTDVLQALALRLCR